MNWGKRFYEKKRKVSRYGQGPLPALVSKRPENKEEWVVPTSDVGGDIPVSAQAAPPPTSVPEPDGEALASDDDDDDVDQFTVDSESPSEYPSLPALSSPLPTWHSQTWRNQQACPLNEGDW